MKINFWKTVFYFLLVMVLMINSFVLTGLLAMGTLSTYKVETIFLNLPQTSATVVLPNNYQYRGSIFVEGTGFHDKNFYHEPVIDPEYDAPEYSLSTGAEYSTLFGGILSFSFPEPYESTSSCPSFLIWNGVLFVRNSQCETYKVHG